MFARSVWEVVGNPVVPVLGRDSPRLNRLKRAGYAFSQLGFVRHAVQVLVNSAQVGLNSAISLKVGMVIREVSNLYPVIEEGLSVRISVNINDVLRASNLSGLLLRLELIRQSVTIRPIRMDAVRSDLVLLNYFPYPSVESRLINVYRSFLSARCVKG